MASSSFQGWLLKRKPKQNETDKRGVGTKRRLVGIGNAVGRLFSRTAGFSKRWFLAGDVFLTYYKDNTPNQTPQGSIPLLTVRSVEMLPAGTGPGPCFSVVTADRKWVLGLEGSEIAAQQTVEEWVRQIRKRVEAARPASGGSLSTNPAGELLSRATKQRILTTQRSWRRRDSLAIRLRNAEAAAAATLETKRAHRPARSGAAAGAGAGDSETEGDDDNESVNQMVGSGGSTSGDEADGSARSPAKPKPQARQPTARASGAAALTTSELEAEVRRLHSVLQDRVQELSQQRKQADARQNQLGFAKAGNRQGRGTAGTAPSGAEAAAQELLVSAEQALRDEEAIARKAEEARAMLAEAREMMEKARRAKTAALVSEAAATSRAEQLEAQLDKAKAALAKAEAQAAAAAAPATAAAPAAVEGTPPATRGGREPKKESRKPPVAMRSVFWEKLPHGLINGTVWEVAQDEDVELDMQFVMAHFNRGQVAKMKRPPSAAGGGGSGKKSSKGGGGTMPSVLDGKRYQNCGITFSRVKLSPDQVYAAVVSMDDEVLHPDKIRQLEALLPLEEAGEPSQLTDVAASVKESGKNPAKAMDPLDYFMYRLLLVPRLRERLAVMQAMAKLEADVPALGASLGALSVAIQSCKESVAMQQFLRYVLALGNFVNGGTNRGGAWGVRLSSIPKLANAKSNVKDYNFVVVAGILAARSFKGVDEDNDSDSQDDEQLPDSVRTLPEFAQSQALARQIRFVNRVSQDCRSLMQAGATPETVAAECTAVGKAAQRIAAEVDASKVLATSLASKAARASENGAPNAERERELAEDAAEVVTELSSFAEEATATAQSIRERVSSLEDAFKRLIAFFGDDPNAVTWAEMMETIAVIVDQMSVAASLLERQKVDSDKVVKAARRAAASRKK